MVLHEKKKDKLSKLTVGVDQIYNVFQPIETPLEIKKFYRGLFQTVFYLLVVYLVFVLVLYVFPTSFLFLISTPEYKVLLYLPQKQQVLFSPYSSAELNLR